MRSPSTEVALPTASETKPENYYVIPIRIGNDLHQFKEEVGPYFTNKEIVTGLVFSFSHDKSQIVAKSPRQQMARTIGKDAFATKIEALKVWISELNRQKAEVETKATILDAKIQRYQQELFDEEEAGVPRNR